MECLNALEYGAILCFLKIIMTVLFISVICYPPNFCFGVYRSQLVGLSVCLFVGL